MMGSEMRVGHGDPLPYTRTHDVAADELPGEAALRRIIDTCRSNGIEPVLMALPAPVSEEEQMEMNRAQLLADELGVPFLNLFDEATGIDFTTDCYDYLGHMNPDGATKLTAFLGAWLSERYELTDHRPTRPMPLGTRSSNNMKPIAPSIGRRLPGLDKSQVFDTMKASHARRTSS